MSASGGPDIVKDGLVFSIDGASRRSTLRYTQTSNILPDPGNWSTGTGGQTGYGANGSSSEQNRVLVSDDPWGRSSITWRTTPDATSGADGGWNSTYYSIDTSYTYRYSVWVRRYTSGTGGTFYFGMNPNPYRNDNNASQGNPYFAYTAISNLTQNQWYLVVAHVFDEGYNGGRHPESGWYENGVKIPDKSYGNTGDQDQRWIPGTTSARHRAYHYYTTNTSSGIEFAYPRIDKIDGKEPTISELLNKGESGIRDLVSTDVYTMTNGNSYINDGGKSTFSFDGTDDIIEVNRLISTSNYSAEFVFKADTNTSGVEHWLGSQYPGTGRIIFDLWTNNALRNFINGTAIYGSTTISTGVWYHAVFTRNSAGTAYIFLNGEQDATGTISTAAPVNETFEIGASNTLSRAFNGTIPVVKVYNRVLSPQEIQQNYNAYKNRFGL